MNALSGLKNFYPRSPCGERPSAADSSSICSSFLSTLSLRRATFKNHIFFNHHNLFLSTLSLRRATELNSSWISSIKNFYPRSPCGERLKNHIFFNHHNLFLSTLSLRRATLIDDVSTGGKIISIHALLAESDLGAWQSGHLR